MTARFALCKWGKKGVLSISQRGKAKGRNAIFQASQRSYSNNLYSNYYYVYQMTPYELKKGGRIQ
ncbi:hypothetical protein [uncultured Acetatifactor sp.]|uniref:hypothetical protein n=1 Tax=uncultured Acetatifactor sp. TaxID=1671927 RepID=UPI0026186328|nr:hypothetical protein [uncultured Acetatifactor sp.]